MQKKIVVETMRMVYEDFRVGCTHKSQPETQLNPDTTYLSQS